MVERSEGEGLLPPRWRRRSRHRALLPGERTAQQTRPAPNHRHCPRARGSTRPTPARTHHRPGRPPRRPHAPGPTPIARSTTPPQRHRPRSSLHRGRPRPRTPGPALPAQQVPGPVEPCLTPSPPRCSPH
ncbi:hypothetical protein DWB68_08500 [Galactobacter valiniphilus]|uniref:Uncharacterized protein n=1 Tax=Galactobacter valiniphilus TaxID=2676122 RepID=A0A399JCH8_9MICC|nr:hypothetical protein DWB68_08500 [Galactobacter valiniphilus]